MLNYHQARQWFAYDPATGWLTWRRTGMRAGYYTVSGRTKQRIIRLSNKTYMEAHVIWLWMTGVWPAHEVDHADLDPFNMVWTNLREATRSQNAANRGNFRTGKLKWAYKLKSGRYKSALHANGVQYHIGTFDTEKEAHNAAYALAQQLHGAFARKA